MGDADAQEAQRTPVILKPRDGVQIEDAGIPIKSPATMQRGAMITPRPAGATPTRRPTQIIVEGLDDNTSDADSPSIAVEEVAPVISTPASIVSTPAATVPVTEGATTNLDSVATQKPANLEHAAVKLGNEVLFEETTYTELLRGKKIGLITNPTGIDSKFVSTIDKLAGDGKEWQLTALFAPEHGIRGAETAGESVKSGVDPSTSTPVFSLHGTDRQGKPLRKPGAEQLANVTMLMYDMQDIGNRSYTYVGTRRKCMEAAKEFNIPFVVLDRPNPMGGDFVDGNILDPKAESLVGWAPVPYLYGLTPGEVAKWMNENTGIGCELVVVPMKGWKRSMRWWDTGLPWIPTSTHMQKAETCWFIALTGFLGELHSVNEGVGYPAPFEYIGAPWIDSVTLASELNGRKLAGLYFRPVYYKPYYGTFKTEQCGGVQAMITDYAKVRPVEAGLHVIEAINKLHPEKDILKMDPNTTGSKERGSMFDKVMGGDVVRKELHTGKPAAEIIESWKAPREAFWAGARKYFLYE